MEHRKDIDGLRAIAVLSIILFHAGFAWIPGGYLGVDVFFVISGFLITGILLRENASRTFTLTRFYEQRARRILPALIVMLFATAVVSYALLMPMEFRAFAQSLMAVTLFSSNILFFKRAGAFDFYFDPPAKLNPLLHTWSLGVEEQFYVVFPVLLALAWRFGRRRLFQLVLLTAVASFVYGVLLDGGYTKIQYARAANFYLLPARAWQLMIGALLAFWSGAAAERAAVPRPWHQATSLLGLTLIVVPVLTYDAYMLRFPSAYSLAPTLGTALILAWGRGTLPGAFLSLPPLVGVGLISYSAYLWHQPLFAFSHYVDLDGALSAKEGVALCMVTLLLAYVSWRWVENPFRDRRKVSRPALIAACGAGSLCLLLFGATFALSRNPPMRGRLFSGRLVQTLTTDWIFEAARECGPNPPVANGSELGCLLNPTTAAPLEFIVVGDSHAGALLPSFQRMAQHLGKQGRLVTAPGCAPLLGFDALGFEKCRNLQERALDLVQRHSIKRVFLVARWTAYTNNSWGNWIQATDEPPAPGQVSRLEFVRRVAPTIDAYSALGVKVFIVEQVPEQIHRPVAIYVRALLQRNVPQALDRLSVTRARHDSLQRFMKAVFAPYRADSRVTFIDLSGGLCKSDVCSVGTEEESYYADINHLSTVGAAQVTDALERLSLLRLP